MNSKREKIRIVKITSDIDENIIKETVLLLKKGGIILFPTTFLYGIGADALNEEALKKIFKIKNRSFFNPISILVKSELEVMKFVKDVSVEAKMLMKTFWPGNLTIIFKAAENIPKILTAGTNKIAIRVPKHPISKAIANAFSNPITATSANISGQPALFDIKDIEPDFAENFDLILDAGKLKGGEGSTIADISDGGIKIIREGTYDTANRIRKCSDRHNSKKY